MTFRQTATNKSSWKKKLKTWTRASSSMSSSMSSLSTKSSSSSSSSTDCSPHGNNMPHDCHRHSTIRSSDSDDWKLGRLLGKGNFGHVVQARHVHSHQIVALKRFSRHALVRQQQRGRRTLELLQREIQIHASVNHPNILSFLGHCSDHQHVTLVLEYAPLGDLFEYSKRSCHNPPERLALFEQVFGHVVSAVAYLQDLQVAHRDIKPENVLLVANGSGVGGCVALQAKLCDFGWSVWYLKAGARHTTLCGTPEYVPPELLATPRRYAAEFVDSWALGVLALELLLGVTPFGASNDHHLTAGADKDDGRPAIYAKIRSFTSLDTSILTWTTATTTTMNGRRCGLDPSSPSRRPAGGDSDLARMIGDFLQTIPSNRQSAMECWERYPHVLGVMEPNHHYSPCRPLSVKQRRQIFQWRHSLSSITAAGPEWF